VTKPGRLRRIVDAIRKVPPPTLATPDVYHPRDVAAMLREIGIALIEVSQPTPIVESRLRTIAARYTSLPVRVVALPTMVMIQIGDDIYQIEGSTRSSLQLDAAGRIDAIASLADAGAISPSAAVTTVQKARRLPPRFGVPATIVGYAITTLGFGMIINPTWASLPAYLFLGLVVGGIVQLSRPLPSLSPVLPTLAAIAVTVLATTFVESTAHDGLLRVISPALVATLPGMSLTIGAMELASSQIISGSSRLVYGISQLAMLLFGVAIGQQIVRYSPPLTQSQPMGEWSLYVAIVVVSVGLYIYLSAPTGSLIWIMAAVAVATLAQSAASTVMSASHAGFIGAFVAVPFALLASRVKTSPPGIVMLLAAFWSLVPGALSFVSVGVAAASGGGGANVSSLAATGAAILSIALGTLVGWSIFYTIDSRLPWSQSFNEQR
jgi:uncharacterized membrane protein YjjP (DUF1212 family)